MAAVTRVRLHGARGDVLTPSHSGWTCPEVVPRHCRGFLSNVPSVSERVYQLDAGETQLQSRLFWLSWISQSTSLAKQVCKLCTPESVRACCDDISHELKGFVISTSVCGCQRKTKDRADGKSKKSAYSPRRDSNLYLWDTSPPGFQLHQDRRAGTPRVRSNKHFRHSPTSSITKHSQALRNTPTPICWIVTAIRRLRGPPLSRKRRVGERR